MLEGLKRFAAMVFRKTQYRIYTLLGTKIDYANEVGDGLSSSTIAAVVNWVARTFPEAPPALWQKLTTGQEEQILDHPFLRLLRTPNPFFTGISLWMATVTDWMVDGNAYWLKVRDNGGSVIELWWVPHWLIEPKGDERTFITHYEYRPDSQRLGVAVEDIVHFRFGSDPDNPRLGVSQLKSVLREVFTDDEAANFTASLLKNMGVPGLVISPEKGSTVSEEDGLAMKRYVKDRFGGDKRGEAMVMTGPTKVEQFGFSPEQLLLRELRRIPEERVSAVTGIPAIVVGFGAGLERSTFTNMGEAREAAYEAGLIPMQAIMAEEVWRQLLPDFIADEDERWMTRYGFDLAKVRVLQEDLYRQAQRVGLAIRDGYAMVSEARRPMGLEVDRGRDDVFLRPANIVTVPAADAGQQVPLPSANGNGVGAAHMTPEGVAAAVEQMLERRELVRA